MHKRRRLLITGAGGFVGLHLIPALIARGHQVVAATRRPLTFGPSVEQVLINDLSDGVDWTPLLQGIDVVIHLAALAHQNKDVKEANLSQNQSRSHCSIGSCHSEGRGKADIFVLDRGTIPAIIRSGLDRI